jgi:ribosomal protein S18 acetylase RimI-like enzyme
MTEFVVREAADSDAPGIAAVHIASWRAAYHEIVPRAVLDGLSIERRTDFWAGLLGDPGSSRTWVAVREGSIVGFLGVAAPGEADAVELPDGTLDLTTLYVDPAAWRRGVGHRLLDAAIDSLATAGVRDLMLWVFAENVPARRFYDSTGWRADGAERDLQIGGEPIPIVRYRRRLPAG